MVALKFTTLFLFFLFLISLFYFSAFLELLKHLSEIYFDVSTVFLHVSLSIAFIVVALGISFYMHIHMYTYM